VIGFCRCRSGFRAVSGFAAQGPSIFFCILLYLSYYILLRATSALRCAEGAPPFFHIQGSATPEAAHGPASQQHWPAGEDGHTPGISLRGIWSASGCGAWKRRVRVCVRVRACVCVCLCTCAHVRMCVCASGAGNFRCAGAA